MYFEIVAWDTSIPSLGSSPWILGGLRHAFGNPRQPDGGYQQVPLDEGLSRFFSTFSGGLKWEFARDKLAYSSPPSIPGPLKREMAARAVEAEKFNEKIFADLRSEGALDRYLAEISVPTLIVWGADDRLVNASMAAAFSAGIKSSKAEIFDHCGHALPRECPDVLAERYLAFLADAP